MKFKVGVRVRVNCPESLKHGRETTITRIDVRASDFGRPFVGAEVDIPNGYGYSRCIFEYHELEPITRPGLSAEDEKFVKDLQDALFAKLPDFNPKPRQGEIVQAGDV